MRTGDGEFHLAWTVLVRSAIGLLRRLVSPNGRIVVSGWPDSEGNSVEVVRALLRRGILVTVLLSHRPPEVLESLRNESTNLKFLKKRSIGGVWAFIRSPVTFCTHGLYLNPPQISNRVSINLWHGDGPKTLQGNVGRFPPCADFVISSSSLFAKEKIRAFGVRPDQLLYAGNPRCDGLRRPASAAKLQRVGISQTKFLVYMPTFRRARSVTWRRGWTDTGNEGDSAQQDVMNVARQMARIAEATGLEFVIKPHPLDAVSWGDIAAVIDDGDLSNAGVALYEILGASYALVTDYSSVWIDYLTIDRPIAFLAPDMAAYLSGRGVCVPNLASLLPGPILETIEDMQQFCHEITVNPHHGRLLRRATAKAIGLLQPPESAEAVLDQLFSQLPHRSGPMKYIARSTTLSQ